jgi:peptide/nickel transport system substrate-binding protein
VDLVNAVPLSALESFSTGVMSYARPSSQTQTLTVNGRSGPLSDVKVRQAISHAIDRGSLVKSLLAGHGAVAGGQLQPAILPIGTKLDGAPYTFDPALSRRLLAESSVKGRATVTLTYSTGDATGAAVAQVLQSDLTKVGITLQLKPLDPAASIAAIVGGKSELGLAQPSASTPTAGGALGFFIQTGGYGGGWDMTKVQSSLDAYTRAHDAQQQAAAVQEFEQYVDSTLPSIALYCPYAAFVAKSNIGGLHVNPLLVYPIQDLWRAQ